MRIPVLLLSLLIVTTHLSLAGDESIRIENAWIRNAPPGMPMLAGYQVITNIGDRQYTLLKADSPDFDAVEVHQSRVENGMARMSQVQQLSLEPGESHVFEPGGLHLMLMHPKRRLKPGDQVPITFHFSNQQTITGNFIVN